MKLLFNITQNRGMQIMIVKDEEGYIFGGFSSTGWKITKESDNFYGTGESYLFGFHGEREAKHYLWTK